MRLEIRPVHGAYQNCLEDILTTVAIYFQKDFELMYAESWGFTFYPATRNLNTILGKRLDAGKNDYFSNLEKFHGIRMQWHFKKTIDEYQLMIQEELMAGNPIAIFMDAYWLPWTKTYKIYHAPHYCLIIGHNGNSDFQCLDPYVTRDICILPGKCLLYGNAKCITFSANTPSTSIDWRKIILNSSQKMLETSTYGNNGFDCMREFSIELGKLQDLDSEINDCPIPLLVPVFLQLKEIGAGRRHFAEVLEYLFSKSAAADIISYAEVFKKLGTKWNRIRKNLMTECDRNTKRNILEESAKEISTIAKEEERVALDLLKLCSSI